MKTEGIDLKAQFSKVSQNFKQLPKNKKIIAASVVGGIVLLAVCITIFLNVGKNQYKKLYTGLEEQEATTIYSMLQEMGVQAQRDANGDIMVPSENYDECLMELAIQGYPHSGRAYDLFAEHSGMTTTEAESKQWELYQLQSDIENTLKQLDSVQSATVNINLAQEGTYVWETTEDKASTASVLLVLKQNINAQQVDGIKTLVSSGVPNLAPENVKVVDSATAQELKGSDEQAEDSLTNAQNLELEQQVQNQIEENAERILRARYGVNGVVAVAKVELDYDKMMTEQMQLTEKEGGGGYVTDFNETYSLEGEQAAGGIVGEENNTDIPTQVVDQENPEEDTGVTNYNKEVHYDYGYIKTQIEKGNAALKSASISVMVDETNMTQTRRDELTSLVANSTGIAAENITVSAIDPNAIPEEEEPDTTDTTQQPTKVQIPLFVWLALGVVALVLVVILVVWILLRRRAKRKQLQQQTELDEQRAQMEQEIEQYKKQLSDAAKAATNPKDEAIINEVKGFAKENPEVTANLLRAWLKEEDK